MGENICKIRSKNLSSKYRWKLLDHTKHSAIYALETDSKIETQKLVKATGSFTGHKIANRITKKITTKYFRDSLKVKHKYKIKDIFLESRDSKLLINYD